MARSKTRTCPHCGSDENILAVLNDMTPLEMFAGCHCAACNHVWEEIVDRRTGAVTNINVHEAKQEGQG